MRQPDPELAGADAQLAPPGSVALGGLILLRAALGGASALAVLHCREDLALMTLIAAVTSDVLDGWLARSLAGRGRVSPYADPAADFVYVAATFAAFALAGRHPWWVLWLIIGMAAQFVATSGRSGPRYDPIGKYYGAALFGAVGVSLTWPSLGADRVVRASVVGATVLTLISRVYMLANQSDA